MRVAVTGGSGFIGSHVVDKCVAAGHKVVVIDVVAPHRPDVAWRDVDISDLPGLVRSLAGCDVVFHLAGIANVNDALADPVGTVEVNVTGTARVWEAARRSDVSRAVLASTVWVYAGTEGDAPATEESPLRVDATEHVYSASKLAAEMVVASFGELYGVPWTVLRYGIPFGPRMRPELVIPRFVTNALAGRHLTIHGDGLQFRNWVYVEDLAEAHLRALEPAGVNQVFNLEGPEPVSVRRLAETVQAMVDPSLPIELLAARPGDYGGRPVSGRKAAEVLGWQPSTSFEDGMRRYLDWYLAEIDGPERQANQA
jgi:UDP-glucose 4-epimerase